MPPRRVSERASAPTRPRARRVTDTATPRAERACGPSIDARFRRKVANRRPLPGRPSPGRGSDAAAIVRCPAAVSVPGFPWTSRANRGIAARLPLRPEGARAPDPPVPRPPLCDRRDPATSRRSSPRRTTSSGPDEHAPPARPSPGERRPPRPARPTSPATSPDERYRRAARTLAAWRSDGTLHKDPRSAVYVYEQTYRVPGTDVERTQRGFFGRLRLEPFGPDAGVLPPRADARGAARGPLPAAARDRRQHEPGRRPLRRPVRDELRAILATLAAGDARRRRPSTTTASATASGSSRPTGRSADRVAGADRDRRGLRAGHDRRRPPPLRDGAPLPRRAADDADRARRTRRSTTC